MFDVVSVDYVQGDVVFVSGGAYPGVCGVVREIDARRARLWLEIPMGRASQGVVVGFDEVERV